jgi:hypothetical protein
MRSFEGSAIVVWALSMAMPGCTPKATQEDCEKMADHIVKVLMRDMDEKSAALAKPMMDQVRAKEIAACVGKSSTAEVKCTMEGKTGAEIQKCRPEK